MNIRIIMSLIVLLVSSFELHSATQEERLAALEGVALYIPSDDLPDDLSEMEEPPSPSDIKSRFDLTDAQLLQDIIAMTQRYSKSETNELIVDKMNELFKEYDAMIGPAAGSVAPKFKSENVDKLSKRNLVLENYLAIGNFGGFPSITIPCGFVNKMPIGLNITGKVKEDLTVLNVAYALESVYPYKGQVAKEVK